MGQWTNDYILVANPDHGSGLWHCVRRALAVPMLLVVYAVFFYCVCWTLLGCRRRSTSCVSRSRYSKRSSVARSWRCVACTRLARGSSVRSPAKRRRSTSTASSVSSCATVGCWTRALDPCTTCASRPSRARTTSTASRRSRSWSARPASEVSPRSLEFPAASRPRAQWVLVRFATQSSAHSQIPVCLLPCYPFYHAMSSWLWLDSVH